ncbi:ATP-binding cassette domain-containing protein, partial [Streptococcus agalactiae]|uniref:ATP-binding cassette domain-containing protein n=3 Tax=Streptococcus agalactiae TaxID=1311 RepID=UPI0027D28320
SEVSQLYYTGFIPFCVYTRYFTLPLEAIDSGTILVNGINLNKIKEKDYFKNHLSYLFQNFGLIDNRTIQENLELAFLGKKITKNEKLSQMRMALKSVNLNIDLNRKIFSLSGGEAQRVAIAKTILKDSPIILADKPMASVDKKIVMKLLS